MKYTYITLLLLAAIIAAAPPASAAPTVSMHYVLSNHTLIYSNGSSVVIPVLTTAPTPRT